MTPARWVAVAILGALAAFGLGRGCRPDPVPRPTLPASVDTVEVWRDRPVEKQPVADKIHYGAVKPVAVKVGDQPSGKGEQQRDAYCQPPDTAPVATPTPPAPRGDTIAPTPAPEPPPRRLAVLPPFAGRIEGSRVRIWSTLSDGRDWAGEWQVRSPSWQFLSSGDSVILRDERAPWRLGRALVKCASGAAAGFLVSTVAGAEPRDAAAIGLPAGCAARLALP